MQAKCPEESAVTPVVLYDRYMSQTQIFTDLSVTCKQQETSLDVKLPHVHTKTVLHILVFCKSPVIKLLKLSQHISLDRVS